MFSFCILKLIYGVLTTFPPKNANVQIRIIDLLPVGFLNPLRTRPGIHLENPGLQI